MGRMYSDDIQSKLKEINDYIGEEYKLTHPKDRRDWRTYEQQFSRRVSTAMKMLDPLIHEAVSTIHI
ncbi:MAG: ISNCY-like element ISFac3 family transposase, partial [bacterium]